MTNINSAKIQNIYAKLQEARTLLPNKSHNLCLTRFLMCDKIKRSDGVVSLGGKSSGDHYDKSSKIFKNIALHKKYGPVFPEDLQGRQIISAVLFNN